MAIVPIPGKVYIRDTRNGNLFEFERSLSEMHFVEQVVLLPIEPQVDPEPAPEAPEPEPAPAAPPKPPKAK